MANAPRTLLYVEDEPDDVYLMDRAFRKQNSKVLIKSVSIGRDALDYLDGKNQYSQRDLHPVPSLVLMDLNLPEMSGLDVLKRIREHPLHGDLPVIVFSSSSDEHDRSRALALGASGFWRKPHTPAQLAKVVHELSTKWLA